MPAMPEEASYSVYLLGFLRGKQEAAQRLAESFGIDTETAKAMIARAPVAVKRGATRVEARDMERALVRIGADVDVRADPVTVGDPAAAPPAPESLPAPAMPAMSGSPAVEGSSSPEGASEASAPFESDAFGWSSSGAPSGRSAATLPHPPAAPEPTGGFDDLPGLDDMAPPLPDLETAPDFGVHASPSGGGVMLEMDTSGPLPELDDVPPPKRRSERPPKHAGVFAQMSAGLAPMQPSPSERPASGAARRAAEIEARHQAPPEEHVGFWLRIPMAFLVPLLGSGVFWLIGMGVWIAFTAIIGALGPCMTKFMALPMFAFYLGLLGEFFTKAAQLGVSDTDDFPQPSYGAPDLQRSFFFGLVLFVLAVVLFGLPFWLEWKGVSQGLVLVSVFVPYVYWPMALLSVGLRGPAMGMNPIVVLQGIWRGGLKYVVVVLLGMITYLVLAFVAGMIAAAGVIAALLGGAFLLMVAGYVAAVQGYLMGCMVGSDPENWEDFV